MAVSVPSRSPKFDGPRGHRRIFDHRTVIVEGHPRHIAAFMAHPLVGGKQAILLNRRNRVYIVGGQIGICVHHALEGAGHFKRRCDDPNRHAGVASRASRSVGKAVTAAEACAGQPFIKVLGIWSRQVGHHLALRLTLQIGAGQGSGAEEKPVGPDEGLAQ